MPDNYIAPSWKLEKKLYQLIISRLDGADIHKSTYQKEIFKLADKGISGFVLFGGKRDEIKIFIDKIQSLSEVPLFIASDIERGVGQQIKGATRFPCQMAMTAAINKKRQGDVKLLKSAITAVADEASDIGINMPLIPVLDVNSNPDNPIICTRAFSDNPREVAWFGLWYIKILKDRGLISSAKHFPGHGDTSMDSHITIPVIRKSYSELKRVDMLPFIAAIKNRAGSIMVGHLFVPAIDSMPSSLSEKTISGVLRERLGFKGIVLTDALNMDALKGIENVATRCIKAGADILLHPVDPEATVKELMSALKSREINEEDVDNRVNCILKAKARLKDIKKTDIDYHRHELLSRHITDMSITLLRHKDRLLPLNEDRASVVLAGDSKLYKSSALRNHFRNVSLITDAAQIKNNQVAIFAVFTSVSAWKGTSGISNEEKELIRRLIKRAKNSIVVSLGSPYVLRHFNAADMLIAAYEATHEAEMSVIKCLRGEMDFNGRIPVNIGL